jgi:predicted transcriptional regulator of viral defense system
LVYIPNMRRTKLELATPKILEFFWTSPVRTFRKLQVANILSSRRSEWKLPAGMSFTNFLEFLIERGVLREITVPSEHYTDEKRYIVGNASIYSIALSLKPKSYLTHGSAVVLHGLTDQIPKTVYLNYEQSPKPQGGSLTQEGIDRAFANRQRQSNLTYKYENFQIVVINGKHTGRLEVTQLPGTDGELLDVTKLERTLIDIAVRPAYAGGVVQVLEAFERAKSLASINTLVATLKKLNYVYPYHQVIGFYMERAGYSESQWQKLLKIGLQFDFHLTYQLPADKKYDPKWRLYYPSGL